MRRFSLPAAKGYGLRLHRIGCARRPFYLIAAMDRKTYAGKQPDRRPDEVIGSVDPMPNDRGEVVVGCDVNRLCYYVGKGAVLSGRLADYLSMAGLWPFTVRVLMNSARISQGKPVKRGLKQTITAADIQEQQQKQQQQQPKQEPTEASAQS